jgi:hypothetical protein
VFFIQAARLDHHQDAFDEAAAGDAVAAKAPTPPQHRQTH